MAFLTSRPASATVTVTPGTRYVVWEMTALRRLLFRTPSLHIAVSSALNRDMAVKVARAAGIGHGAKGKTCGGLNGHSVRKTVTGW